MELFQSTRDPKIHIMYLNKIAKDPRRPHKALFNDLKPIILAIVKKFSRLEQMNRLNTQQIAIFIWTLGSLDLEYIHSDGPLWTSIESYLLSTKKLEQLEPIGLSSVSHGFQKANRGTNLLWEEISKQTLAKADQFDRVGISLMINALGRSD